MSENIQNKTSEFIEKAIKKHGDKYDYSKVEYVNAKTKVSIICSSIDEITGEKHNEFWQIPYSHLQGYNCPKCRGQMNQELFIKRAQVIHNNKYDYSKVEYVKSRSKVAIICNEIDEITGEKHNEFWQLPHTHLKGASCPKCTGHFMDQEFFIKRASVIHNNKYDYSKVEYKSAKENVCIICPEHREFLQTPDTHLRGANCNKCSNVYKPNTNEWVEASKKIHGDRYDYSKVEYANNRIKVSIICKEHGEFWQTPANHTRGKNCPKCTGHYMDQSFFLEKANEIHKDESGNPLYDYSLLNFKDSHTHITVICPVKDPMTGKEHGTFSKTPNTHLNGQGCPLCTNVSMSLKMRMSNEEFIKKAIKKHDDKYDYLTSYEMGKMKIHIKCKKCEYKFWQNASSHLSGVGCPSCNESKLEKEVTKYLNELDIAYEKQKKFEWLGRQSLDFYLPDYNIAIECQGIQHFEPKDWFGGVDGFKIIVDRDNRKLKKCLSNNIQMIYVVDNEKYLKNDWHFDTVKPFSGNVSYKTIHLNNFENYINHFLATIKYL